MRVFFSLLFHLFYKDDDDQAVNIKTNQHVSLTFSLKYLVSFSKGASLAIRIQLMMNNDVPLLVMYHAYPCLDSCMFMWGFLSFLWFRVMYLDLTVLRYILSCFSSLLNSHVVIYSNNAHSDVYYVQEFAICFNLLLWNLFSTRYGTKCSTVPIPFVHALSLYHWENFCSTMTTYWVEGLWASESFLRQFVEWSKQDTETSWFY